MHEYKQLGLSVGDKVSLDISKVESLRRIDLFKNLKFLLSFMGDKSDEACFKNLKMELDIYKEKIKSISSSSQRSRIMSASEFLRKEHQGNNAS